MFELQSKVQDNSIGVNKPRKDWTSEDWSNFSKSNLNGGQWRSFYKLVNDSIDAGKDMDTVVKDAASQLGLDPEKASLKYALHNKKQNSKAIKEVPVSHDRGIIENEEQPAKPYESNKSNMVLLKGEHITTEQLFVDPASTMPSKYPIRLYDITDNPSELLRGGKFLETIPFIPIAKEYIKSKYGGGSFVVRELMPDGTEKLITDKNGHFMSSIEIGMTQEEFNRRALLRGQQAKDEASQIPKPQTPADKLVETIVAKAADTVLNPVHNSSDDPITLLSKMMNLSKELHTNGDSDSVRRLNDKMDEMQKLLVQAQVAVKDKEIEFLNKELQNKKVNASSSDVIKNIVTDVIKEYGLKKEDEEGVIMTALKTAARDQATVNKFLDIAGMTLLSIVSAVSKNPVNNNIQIPTQNTPALNPAPPVQAVQKPPEEVKQVEQDQVRDDTYYRKLNTSIIEQEVLKFVKIISTGSASYRQIEWILEGESIPLIYPEVINEINISINDAWKVQIPEQKQEFCNKVRNAFTKFPEPLKGILASEKGKIFIDNVINSYVLEEDNNG